MSLQSRPHLGGTLVVIALVSSACSMMPTSESATPEPLVGWSSTTIPEDEGESLTAGKSTSDDDPPAALGLVSKSGTESTATTAAAMGEVRRTAETIDVSVSLTTFDFGSGDVEATEVLGDHPNGSAGLYLPGTQHSSTETLDSIGWASSGGTLVVLVEVGPTVAEVHMTVAGGGADRVAPSPDGMAVLGVRADGVDHITIDAFDAAGALVGTCASDGTFLTCTP